MTGNLLIVLFDGLAFGMLLFVLSVGLSVTLGLMNFVNLGHGAFGMLGGYVALVVTREAGLSFFLALPAALETDYPLPVVDEGGNLMGVVSSREMSSVLSPPKAANEDKPDDVDPSGSPKAVAE